MRLDGKPHFPDDWIAPGEFRFCAKCGRTMQPPEAPLCYSCRNRGMKEPVPDPPGMKSHEELQDERISLATERKDAGVKPLFWMKEAG